MNKPKVSIMVPTYNQSKYIIRAIESALQQDYENLEVVVADDNSQDETQAIVQQFLSELCDDRVKYFRNEENVGILRNYRRTLYDRASGDWVINLDGDDFFVDASFISKAVKIAQSDLDVVLVFGDYCEHITRVGENVAIVNSDLPEIMNGSDFVTRYAEGEIYWNHNSILYRRQEAMEIGFYWDEVEPRNDWESFLRLVMDRRVGYIDTIAAAWVQHDSNETKRIDGAKYLANFDLIDGIGTFALTRKVEPELVSRWVSGMRLKVTRGCFIAYLRNRDVRGAFSFLKSAAGKGRGSALPLKALLDLGVLGRMVLASHPLVYERVKALVRGKAKH